MSHYAVVDRSTTDSEFIRNDGSKESFFPPSEILEKLDELRNGMYTPKKGTWFSARYVITRPGNYRIDYNYDEEPAFTIPPVAGSYKLDLQHFPRDDEHIPDWLRRKLQEAEGEQQ
ncbi:hypothetical protein EV190_103203 [Actinorugispora endophytica]|uniref:Uncharacterized protein n=2 Tax=Actinorugispora endophytica TaxID=1605990 RepID=A0A4R6V4G3_9ACTN|nr:hypothetical protein EV190_103203 [Actinorugispora endophytica]